LLNRSASPTLISMLEALNINWGTLGTYEIVVFHACYEKISKWQNVL